ncbi:MAG: hypothetical protein FD123_3894 [Bacteroidetes bacterium]|nr:MAG: hypothetical protein FD123_3894 [Bacteroidota bacterium]
MPAGDSLPEHISNQPALLVILSGKIRYCDTSGQKELGTGATHPIEAHSPHGLIADTESVLLLIR